MTALNEALTAEVRRLKVATQEMASESDPSKGMANQQLPMNSQMFQVHQQQPSQLNIHHLQHQHQQSHSQVNFQQQQQNGGTATKPESNQ